MPPKTIQLAADLQLDETAATQTFGIVARKEGGKTYLASKLVEELCRLQCPVVVIDPVGNWWGLTVAANGEDPGLSFVVLGGERGDVELSPEGGAVVAELVIARNLNVVIDVSSFSKTSMRRFVADFCERFFEKSKTKRQARMVVFEEAQRFAPQQFKGQERMLGAVEDIVRLGRNYGLGCMLISQRPQSVNKEVLSQVECLFVGQLNESHARKALLAWIVEKDEDLKTRLDELTTLERGQFFCWSPSWLRTFQKVRILPKWTFDASRTPRIGESSSQVEPPLGRLSTDELETLRAAMQEPVPPGGKEKSKDTSDHERSLRLESERQVSSLRQLVLMRDEQLAKVRAGFKVLFDQLNAIARELKASHPEVVPDAVNEAKPSPRPVPPKPPRVVERAAVVGTSGFDLGKCPRAILTVLVQQGQALSKARLALMAGYSASSGSYSNAIGALRARGWIEGREMTAATLAGRKALGPVPALPTGGELFEHWLRSPRLDKCSRTILTALRDHPRGLDKAQLSSITGYSASSGSYSNSIGRLRTLGLIEGRGMIQISSDLL